MRLGRGTAAAVSPRRGAGTEVVIYREHLAEAYVKARSLALLYHQAVSSSAGSNWWTR